MIEILSYDFFQNALIAGVLVSLISWTLGSIVVLRREPNITHSIANVLFVGIVVSFFFAGNYYLFGVLFAILGALWVSCLEKFTSISRESSKEILSQIGLAAGIFGVGFLGNIQLDVFNFLFWNILFVEKIDIVLLICMGIIWWVLWHLCRKKFLRITLSPEIAKSQWIRVAWFEFGYLLYLALFIAFSLKIFWVLLLWAFLVLPGNIGKMLSQSFSWVFFIATVTSILAVIFGLFVSYFLDTSAGASIVLILGIMFLGSIFWKRK